MSLGTTVRLSVSRSKASIRLSSAGSGRRSLLPQATSPKIPARVCGLASASRSRMFWRATPTFAGHLLQVRPVTARRDGETMVVRLDLRCQVVAEVRDRGRMVKVPGVGNPLEEQEREHVALEVGRVHGSPQAVGRTPPVVTRAPTE